MTSPVIRPAAGQAELDAVADLVALSFNELDACRYLVPPLDDRQRVMRSYFAILVEHAAVHGKVHVTDDLSAAAVWFDRTVDMPAPADYEQRQAAGVGPYLDRFAALDEVLDTNHPHEPHWHLAFLAVHPDRQGQGLGSHLMGVTHSELDTTGVDAYLEATNEENHKLYLRHGYVDMEPCAITLPDGTAFLRMWRKSSAA
jgi:ribosomal protein S18 acetylase RimI-like enzyme